MLKPVLALSAVMLFPLTAMLNPPISPQEAAPPAGIPADTKNPVKTTPELKAKAKKMYGYDCEMCHNANGDGKSDLAKDMSLTMTDLSDAKTLSGKSDADIYNIIQNGKGKMPAEDPSRAKPDDIWNLVLYVRGLGKN